MYNKHTKISENTKKSEKLKMKPKLVTVSHSSHREKCKPNISNVGEDMEKQKFLYTTDGNVSWYNYYWKTSWQSLGQRALFPTLLQSHLIIKASWGGGGIQRIPKLGRVEEGL